MKILHHGTPPGEKLYRGHCSVCDTTIECRQCETQAIPGNWPFDRTCLVVACPVCDSRIYVYVPDGHD